MDALKEFVSNVSLRNHQGDACPLVLFCPNAPFTVETTPSRRPPMRPILSDGEEAQLSKETPRPQQIESQTGNQKYYSGAVERSLGEFSERRADI